MAMTGGCVCGNVRYTIETSPLFVLACHCADCQRSTGSAFVINMGVPIPEFTITGETNVVTNPTPTGAGYDANFCPNCATVIWSKYHFIDAPLIAVRAGTLDDQRSVTPQLHIFTRSKAPWVQLPDDLPAFEEWYDPTEVWTAESLARFEKLMSQT